MLNKAVKAIFLFVLFSLFVTTYCHSAVGPRLVIREKMHDAGQVLEGAIVEHSFKVFNEGDQILSINKVRPG